VLLVVVVYIVVVGVVVEVDMVVGVVVVRNSKPKIFFKVWIFCNLEYWMLNKINFNKLQVK